MLLDYYLPDIDGGEILKLIRENPETRLVPVIMMSYDASKEAEACLDYGADGFYSKDSDPEKCRYLIEALLRRVRMDHGIIEKGDIRTERKGFSVFKDGKFLKSLSPEQFGLLELLLAKSPEYVDECIISRVVLGVVGYADNSDIIRGLAYRLRQALGQPLGSRITSRSGYGWAYIYSQDAASQTT